MKCLHESMSVSDFCLHFYVCLKRNAISFFSLKPTPLWVCLFYKTYRVFCMIFGFPKPLVLSPKRNSQNRRFLFVFST